MEESEISQVACVLKPASANILKGKDKLCLSTHYLIKLNSIVDQDLLPQDMNSSFHVLQSPSNVKINIQRDLQFLQNLLDQTRILKIIPDVINTSEDIVLSKFKRLITLEINKISIQRIVGLQKFRSHLQNLTIVHSLDEKIEEVLENCGGDHSQKYVWPELKTANFSYNRIRELDNSFEFVPFLHTLDLSHNELKSVDGLSVLTHLKHLNLSYNKLDSVPHFRGQIVNRLQILILKNNFIEDILNLTLLPNLVHLDLSQNSIIEHRALVSVAHLATLQWLNLQGNPMSYHPHHRNSSCNYLHNNTSTTKFVLDNQPLNLQEKTLTGSIHPMTQATLTSSNNSHENSQNVSIERPRRVRNVMIEDAASVTEKSFLPATPSSTSHLELKKQIVQLREEHGESWLNSHSMLLVQNLQEALESNKTEPFSSTPKETALEDTEITEIQKELSDIKSEDFETANDQSGTITNDIFTSANCTKDEESEISDSDDIEGEESIFLATVQGETEQVFVVVTQSHISERNVTTSKERARWHMNMVLKHGLLPDSNNTVKLDFDTVRRDKKQRIYELENSEVESFLKLIESSIQRADKLKKNIVYQCMKCSEKFVNKKKQDIVCPKCESILVIENA